MLLSVYQEQAMKFARYPMKGQNLEYTVIGLAGETGELVNHIQRLIRDFNGIITQDMIKLIVNELGDICWYVSGVCFESGVKIDEIPLISPYSNINAYIGMNRLCISLSSHVGRLCQVFLEDDGFGGYLQHTREMQIGVWCGSVLWHVDAIAQRVGHNLTSILRLNIEKLESRLASGTLNGAGDSR
jgi:NTP pyrophosphatase (non-canonical NTP hydrolase)